MNEITTKPRFDVKLLDETKKKTQYDKSWTVILFNDDYTPMDRVIVVLCKVLKFSAQKAEEHMIEAHKKGRTIVLNTNRELAELRAQQLSEQGLTVEIEQC